ncbi:MAG: aminotransferase class I/II-fold pyridoxal phosphate-dependent enzyme [Trueperaceae bacterium]|nr:MAG: aminotransferase class I/II-fold pyridoxal phosphate-dependent enzyme [Trueperaceae bacterium]
MRPETLAVHLGLEPDAATGAIAPPIHLSTTFERGEDGSYPHGYVYSRPGNPTRDALERALALLHGASEAAAFASGSAATSAVFRALPSGSHVVVPRDLYHGVRVLLREVLAPAGLRVSEVDQRDLGAIEAALTEQTRLIWVETPSNPLLHLTDVEAVVALARAHAERAGARVLVAQDATWTPPGWADPFALGVDLVVHATTKYLAGHSDVLGGAVVAADPIGAFERVRALQRVEGAVPSPFECWLTLRGLRTLPHRLRAHAVNAQALAAFLVDHPAVRSVHYPGLPGQPGFEVAARQMTGFGGMLSVRLAGGEGAAMAVAAGVRLWRRGTSLGGVESLIEHRASIEPEGTATPRDLLRLSAGIEHHDDLIDDLAQALARLAV